MDKAERARQKRAAKKKEVRAHASAERARRVARQTASAPTERARRPADALDWPVFECWATETWYEQGAHVHVAFARRHESGRVAAAFVEVDLADRGVVAASWRDDLTEAGYRFEVSERAQSSVMREVTPALAVKLVETGRAFGASRGHVEPESLALALELFGGVSSAACKDEILTGAPPPVEPKPERKGLFGWLFG